MEVVPIVKRQSPSLRNLLKSPQRKTYSLLTITLVIIVLFFILAISPAVIKISDLQKEIKANSQIKDSLETKKKTLETLRIKYNELKSKIDIFNQSFPDTEEAGALMVNIDEIAKKYGLLFTSITFNPVQVADKDKSAWNLANPVQIRISLEANYDGLKNFISHLEKYPRILTIDSVSVTNRFEVQTQTQQTKKSSSSAISNNLSAGVTFWAFFYKEVKSN